MKLYQTPVDKMLTWFTVGVATGSAAVTNAIDGHWVSAGVLALAFVLCSRPFSRWHKLAEEPHRNPVGNRTSARIAAALRQAADAVEDAS